MGGVLAMLDKFSGPSSSRRSAASFDVYTDKQQVGGSANSSPRRDVKGRQQQRGRGGASGGGSGQENHPRHQLNGQSAASAGAAIVPAAKAPAAPPSHSQSAPPQPLLQFEGMSLKQVKPFQN